MAPRRGDPGLGLVVWSAAAAFNAMAAGPLALAALMAGAAGALAGSLVGASCNGRREGGVELGVAVNVAVIHIAALQPPHPATHQLPTLPARKAPMAAFTSCGLQAGRRAGATPVSSAGVRVSAGASGSTVPETQPLSIILPRSCALLLHCPVGAVLQALRAQRGHVLVGVLRRKFEGSDEETSSESSKWHD